MNAKTIKPLVQIVVIGAKDGTTFSNWLVAMFSYAPFNTILIANC